MAIKWSRAAALPQRFGIVPAAGAASVLIPGHMASSAAVLAVIADVHRDIDPLTASRCGTKHARWCLTLVEKKGLER